MKVNNPLKPSLWKGFLWMVALWLLSVIALGAVSMIFRVLMHAAGMTN